MKKVIPTFQKKFQSLCFAFLLLAFANSSAIAQNENGGIIADDQALCIGETPTLLTNVESPSGGDASEPFEYLWMTTNVFTNDPTTWNEAPGDNDNLSYQPPSTSSTTFYARCARRSGDAPGVYAFESNIVTITILSSPTNIISGPSEAFVGATLEYEAAYNFGATYRWKINGITYGYDQNFTFPYFFSSSEGTYELSLTVTGANGCSITTNQNVTLKPIATSTKNEIGDPCACDNLKNFVSGDDYYIHDQLFIKSNPGETWTFIDLFGTALDRDLNSLGGQTFTEKENTPGTYYLDLYFNPEAGGFEGFASNGVQTTENVGPGLIFDPLACVCPDSPLPVELGSFEGTKGKTNINLRWVTLSEVNNSHFELERSNDGIRFEMIGKIEGKGNTLETSVYDFVDEQPSNGINYYQLKQVDFDGQYEYSNVISIEMDFEKSELNISPNPVREKTKIILGEVFPNTILEIVSPTGQIVKEISVNNTVEEIDMQDLPNGIYFFRIRNNNTVQNLLHKVVKY